MCTSKTRRQQSYNHRVRELLRTTGNPDIVAEFGVPRSTAIGWRRGDYQPVVSDNALDRDHVGLVQSKYSVLLSYHSLRFPRLSLLKTSYVLICCNFSRQ